MTIIGIGIDLVHIPRIQSLLERWESRFLERLFTDAEQRQCLTRSVPYASLAGRFAVKEALLKALGTGWAGGIAWRDIEVVNAPSGQPIATVHGRVQTLMNQMGATQILVSLSHDKDYAIAQVILGGTCQ